MWAFAELDLEALAAVCWSVVCVLALYTVYLLLRGIVAWADAIIPDIRIPSAIPFVGGASLFGWLKNALADIVTTVHNDFYYWSQEAQHAWNQWITSAAQFVHAVSYSVDFWAGETERAFDWTKRYVIPAAIDVTVGPILADYRKVRTLVLGLKGDVAAIPHDVTKAVGAAPRAVSLPEVKVPIDIVRAGAVAVPIPYADPWPRIRDIGKQVEDLWDGTKKLAGGIAAGGIIGLIGATIFDHFGLGWLRCSGVNRLGRSLCGLGGLIEELFGAALLALSFGNVCEIVSLAIGFAEDAKPFFAFMADATEELLGCQKVARPPRLPAPTIAPPTGTVPAPPLVLT